MKLDKLKTFLEQCHKANITPPSGMLVVIEDFEEVIPEEMAYLGQCEYNHRIGNEMVTVEITSKKMLDVGFEHCI